MLAEVRVKMLKTHIKLMLAISNVSIKQDDYTQETGGTNDDLKETNELDDNFE